MRRPLIRHLSEGGGNGDGSRRQSTKSGDEIRGSYGWDCREYGHHLSSLDLLKVPNNSRGQLSPESRITTIIHRYELFSCDPLVAFLPRILIYCPLIYCHSTLLLYY